MKLLLLSLLLLFIKASSEEIKLPEPQYKGETSLEEAILARRSIREYEKASLTLKEVSQLLWSAQGITEKQNGFRTAPSAGATYPLELYLIAGEVNELSPGIYRYEPKRHTLIKTADGDHRKKLEKASLQQGMVLDAPVSIVVTAVYERTTRRYGERGVQYVHIEVGHVGQNIYLQSLALGLATVAIGAFRDKDVKKALNLPKDHEPLYIMPVGKEAKTVFRWR